MLRRKLSEALTPSSDTLRVSSSSFLNVSCLNALHSHSTRFSSTGPKSSFSHSQAHKRSLVYSKMPSVSRGLNGDYTTYYSVENSSQPTKVKTFKCSSSSHSTRRTHRCFVAFGSNMGDRLGNIERACSILSSQNEIQLVRTSSIWQTQAMYVEDQDEFLNGVLEIQTQLDPLELLDKLQETENILGRRRVVEKGPRTLDLDILLYDNSIIKNERLTVPHPLMLEREFVLQPLCELIPHERPPDSSQLDFAAQLSDLPKTDSIMSTSVQLTKSMRPLTPLVSAKPTLLRSILNITPDSFSDGGLLSPSDSETLTKTIKTHISGGAKILDVGGESTRPKASPISEDEEISRVVPTIKLIKSIAEAEKAASNIAVSIDTYHAPVARAAVKAGADIVNDISGGTLDPNMLKTLAELGCPVILMHMRGNPQTMMSTDNTSYPNGLIETIGSELLLRVRAAEQAGVRRWKIILDPGIGFAKNQIQNLEILKRFDQLRNFKGLEGFPWLIGASRKRFIGSITGVKEASERKWGTAVTVAASVQGGADIVRIHDVQEMQQIVAMSDAIWRQTT